MSQGPAITLSPIGVVRTPFADRKSAPRQPPASGAEGRIDLFAGRGFEHALSDIEGWDHLWVVFLFHLNAGWRPKVLPPRSPGQRRGVFSTRSPHRPNPIGLSAVRLVRVEGLTLFIAGVDMVDGSPVLDIKPYVPYSDSIPGARTGWLEPAPGGAEPGSRPPDPDPGYEVSWSPLALEQARWLLDEHGVDLRAPAAATLSLGPQPHPYRRIRSDDQGPVLAVKDWRVRFGAEGRRVEIRSISTGYRPSQLAGDEGPPLSIHRAFVARFGLRPGTPGG